MRGGDIMKKGRSQRQRNALMTTHGQVNAHMLNEGVRRMNLQDENDMEWYAKMKIHVLDKCLIDLKHKLKIYWIHLIYDRLCSYVKLCQILRDYGCYFTYVFFMITKWLYVFCEKKNYGFAHPGRFKSLGKKSLYQKVRSTHTYNYVQACLIQKNNKGSCSERGAEKNIWLTLT